VALVAVAVMCGGFWLMAQRRRAEADAAAILVASVSHELRTPLQSVSGYAELLARGDVPPQRREWLDRLVSESSQLSALIRQLLDYSALRGELGTPTAQMVRPGELAREVISAFQVSAREKGLTLTLECSDTLPAVIWIDGVRLRQVLANLISNAVRYTPAGFVKVNVSFNAGDCLCGEVEDTGVGIAKEELKELFRPFKRGREAKAHERNGLGLGLAITREAVDRMKGELSVRSEPAKGSVFRFSIPAKPAIAAPAKVNPARCDLGGRRVLVVEDHPFLGDLFAEWVGLLGGKAELVRSVREANEVLALSPGADFLLADVVLSDGDGLTLGKPGGDGAVCWRIAMSANDGAEILKRASEEEWDEFLTKPFSLQELSNALTCCPEVGVSGGSTATAALFPMTLKKRGELQTLFEEEMRRAAGDFVTLLAAGDFAELTVRTHSLRNSAVFLGEEFVEITAELAVLERLAGSCWKGDGDQSQLAGVVATISAFSQGRAHRLVGG
jgi:CheY-like chemotaxis protein